MKIKDFLGGPPVPVNSLTSTKTRTELVRSVRPILWTETPGEKTASLSVSVTLEDETVLSASEMIEFCVPDFYFAVFIRSAKNDSEKHPFLINDSRKAIEVGHAAWKIGVSPREADNIDANLMTVANLPWGLGVAPNPNISFPLDKALIDFAEQHKTGPDNTPPLEVGVAGQLGNGGTGFEVKRYAIQEREDAIKALTYIKTNKESPHEYNVPNYNCVDQCLGALGNFGLPTPNCKEKRKLKYRYPDRSRTKSWEIQLSIPKALETKLTQ
jgi:hypothetical protein